MQDVIARGALDYDDVTLLVAYYASVGECATVATMDNIHANASVRVYIIHGCHLCHIFTVSLCDVISAFRSGTNRVSKLHSS